MLTASHQATGFFSHLNLNSNFLLFFRFIFLLLGPKLSNIDYHEVGRSISTLMANQQFHNIAFKADNRKELLSAINEFLDDSIVLPPGDWERQALLPIEEIKAKSEAIRRRKENALKKAQEAQGILPKPAVLPCKCYILIKFLILRGNFINNCSQTA